MNTVAYDALGIEHNSAAGPIFLKVDHSAPVISLSGELLSEHPVKFHLNVSAADGNASSLATAQSGMKGLEFFVDGQLAGRYPESANPPACNNVQEGRNVGSCGFTGIGLDLKRSLTGKHVIKIVAKDSLNHSAEKSVEVNLPADTTAPSLVPSGQLYAASGGWLTAGPTSVTLEGLDSETGVAEEAAYIDGKLVGSPATQECVYGGCSFIHTFTPSLAGYAEGAHTVKVLAKDGAGKVSEASWTVKVDSVAPTVTSIGAPEVPNGWMPQLTSFNLQYGASDAGAGIKKVEVIRPSRFGGNLISSPYSSACTGSSGAPCSATVEGTAAISTTTMAQGVDTVIVKAYDAFEHVSAEKSLTVKVDRGAPVVTATGPLMQAGPSTLVGLGSKLTLVVKDPGGGVGSVELLLDEELSETLSLAEILESGGAQSCAGENCELKYTLNPTLGEMKASGAHSAKVVVRDVAGHVSSVSHEVKLDTSPPSVKLAGPLAEAIGESLSPETAALEAIANDGEGQFASGLASIKVEVDGVRVLTERSESGGGSVEEHLWVADENNNRIQIFDEKGGYLGAFGSAGSGPGQLNRPTAVAVDAKGNIWVADANNNRIEEFGEDGEFLKAVGSADTGNAAFSGPEGIAIDAKGNIWVADTYNARLQKFNENGEFIKAVGTRGTGVGQLVEPTGIDVGPGGNVWVADWSNNKVVVFNEAGEYVRQFGSSGTGNGQFARPDAVAVDAGGNVWVGDQNNSRIQEFNQNGEYVTRFGSSGSGPGQFSFNYPMGIGTDSHGNLWISDTNQNRVQKWQAPNYVQSAPPIYSSSFGGAGTGSGQFAHPADVALDSKGNLWAVDENNNRIEEFNEKGEFLKTFASVGSGNGLLSSPRSLAIDAKGNIWVMDAGNHRIEEFSEKGEFLKSVGSAGTGNGQFSAAEGIAIDAKGNIWVADTYNARLQKFNENGEFIKAVGTRGTGVGQLVEPTGIDVGPGGNVWVADWSNNKVVVFNEAGEYVRQFGSSGTGNGQFARPDAVAVDARGVAWIGDQNNERVQGFNQAGEYLTQFGAGGSGAGQFSFGYPMGIATDAKGSIWVTDTNNNRVQKWGIPNFAATYVSSFGAAGSGEGQFNHPAGIAMGLVHGCQVPSCPLQKTTNYTFSQASWGSGPHSVVVTATDAAGNVDAEEVRVNEPLSVVAPTCPSASPETMEAGEIRSGTAAVSGVEEVVPAALEPSEAPQEEASGVSEPMIAPAVTRNAEGVSLDEQGIDVVSSTMGGGVEDQIAGSFTVAQAVCLQPLQKGAGAKAPMVVGGSAVVYPNAVTDTDTVVRPTALGTAVIEHLRGEKAPKEFEWALGLEPGEELVKLESGAIVILAPQGSDGSWQTVPTEPPGGWGPEELNDVEAQLAQAERELILANNQLTGEVRAVIAAPEVVLSSGEVVPGLLRITPGNVIKAELPPGTFAEAEALIIKANPAAKTEDICAFVMASAPQYYPTVCGRPDESEPGEQPDPSETVSLLEATQSAPQPLRGRIEAAQQKFNLLYGIPTPVPLEIWENMTPEEKGLCVAEHDFKRCMRVLNDGKRAAEIEDQLFNVPNGSQDTKANAFRHSLWTSLMEISEHYSGFGLLFAEAHEGKEYANTAHPQYRKASQMDMMNDKVGWFNADQTPEQGVVACADMLDKVPDAIYLGTAAYPFRWGKLHEWAAFRLVYRKFQDFRESPNGVVVRRNGRTCSQVW